jgi:hypothetical protein
MVFDFFRHYGIKEICDGCCQNKNIAIEGKASL